MDARAADVGNLQSSGFYTLLYGANISHVPPDVGILTYATPSCLANVRSSGVKVLPFYGKP